jgi:hypothetical protein
MGNTVTTQTTGSLVASPPSHSTSATTPSSPTSVQFSSFFSPSSSSTGILSGSNTKLSQSPTTPTHSTATKVRSNSVSATTNTSHSIATPVTTTTPQSSSTFISSFYNGNTSKVFTVFSTSVQVYDPKEDPKKITVYALPLLQNVQINCSTFLESEDLLITGDSDGKIRIYQVSWLLQHFSNFIGF